MSHHMRKNKSFLNDVTAMPKCEEIHSCIQCGTCSATCPVAKYMNYTPRKLFAMIRAGMEKEVLNSSTIWYCASCYSCVARCPMSINITEVMYQLKEKALKDKKAKKHLIGPGFTKAFVNNISMFGRVFEPLLAPSFMPKVGIRGMIDNSLFGLSMFLKGRLPITPTKIKRLSGFKKILKKAQSLQGESK